MIDNMRRSCGPAIGHIALMMNKPLLPETTKILESFVTAVCPALFLLCSHPQSGTSFEYKTFKIPLILC